MKVVKKRISLGLIALFALLFLGKFVSNLLEKPRSPMQRYSDDAGAGFTQDGLANQEIQNAPSFAAKSASVRNYASSRIVIKQVASADQIVDQKYERVASLGSHSSEFDSDRQKLTGLTKELEAVVQQEDSAGLQGSRHLRLVLGVVPASFESLVERLKAIGTLDSITVNKTDKTADFKALAAKRLSLEKSRDGLRALKVPGAALSDLISLETRILEIEGQIQELGVSLGDFDETNSLCTVHFSLLETAPVPGPNVLLALLDALAWTVPLYLGLLLAAALVLAAAVLTTILIEKIKALTTKPKPDQPAS